MDQKQFWTIIKRTRTLSNGFKERQTELLIRYLRTRSLEEIEEFACIYFAFLTRSAREEVHEAISQATNTWGAIDEYIHFRAWLISCGEAIFRRVLRRPLSLFDIVGDDDWAREGKWFLQDFEDAAGVVYHEKSGKPLPVWRDSPRVHSYRLQGYDDLLIGGAPAPCA